MPNWFGKRWGEEAGGRGEGRCQGENILCCVIRRKERGAPLIFLHKSNTGRKPFTKTPGPRASEQKRFTAVLEKKSLQKKEKVRLIAFVFFFFFKGILNGLQ